VAGSTVGTVKWLRTKNDSFAVTGAASASTGVSRFAGSISRAPTSASVRSCGARDHVIDP